MLALEELASNYGNSVTPAKPDFLAVSFEDTAIAL